MSDITVIHKEEETQDKYVSFVEVDEAGSTTKHEVTVAEDDYQRLTPEGTSVDELVRKSFRFLLEREPKESILSNFNITVIGNYFPEYNETVKERLQQRLQP